MMCSVILDPLGTEIKKKKQYYSLVETFLILQSLPKPLLKV